MIRLIKEELISGELSPFGSNGTDMSFKDFTKKYFKSFLKSEIELLESIFNFLDKNNIKIDFDSLEDPLCSLKELIGFLYCIYNKKTEYYIELTTEDLTKTNKLIGLNENFNISELKSWLKIRGELLSEIQQMIELDGYIDDIEENELGYIPYALGDLLNLLQIIETIGIKDGNEEYEIILICSDDSFINIPYSDLSLAIEDAKIIDETREYEGLQITYVCVDQCFSNGDENILIWENR